jgi:hypothetical protein
VHVDPIKPTLKAPDTKRLKLEYDGLLSNIAFNFNLHRYNQVRGVVILDDLSDLSLAAQRWGGTG